jgi:predicted PurR-regulated permease PerM
MQTSTNDVPGIIKILVAVALIAVVIWPFWHSALWSLAVVTSLWGFRERQLAKGKSRWVFSPAAMTVWVALCLLIPFGLIASAITVEATTAAAKLTDPGQRALIIEAAQAKLALVTPYLSKFGISPEQLPAQAAEKLGPLVGSLLASIAGTAGTLIIDSVFFVFFTYVFFSRGDAMAETLNRALPRAAAGGVNVAGQAMKSSLLGVVATAIIQGAVGAIGCNVAGLPSPLLFFLAMAIASLIPGVGTMLVWGPAAAWLAISGHYLAAGGLAAWGILVIGSVDNFVRPVVAARFGNLDFIVATLGSLGGLTIFGFSGVLLGPTLLAAGIELLRKEEMEP